MRSSRSRLAAVLTTAGLILAVPTTAAGQTRSAADPSGDAPASADVTAVQVTNGAHQVTVRIHVRNLAKGSDVTLYVNHEGPGRYVLRTAPLGKGLLTFARGYNEKPVKCSTWTLTRYTGPKSTMVVTIPQRCFGARAGGAKFNLTMWQAGGQGSDTVAAMPMWVRRG